MGPFLEKLEDRPESLTASLTGPEWALLLRAADEHYWTCGDCGACFALKAAKEQLAAGVQ